MFFHAAHLLSVKEFTHKQRTISRPSSANNNVLFYYRRVLALTLWSIVLSSVLYDLSYATEIPLTNQSSDENTIKSTNTSVLGTMDQKCRYNKYIIHPPDKTETVEVVPSKSDNPRWISESKHPTNYDPYALADFFDVAQHPVNDGLLIGYDDYGIPLVVTERDLDTLTDTQLIDKMRAEPHFHDFREGYSLKRIQVIFPDFKLPPLIHERNRLAKPGQITVALLVVDENEKPVYKLNGEKAMYFLRPVSGGDLSAIQEMEEQEDDWDMEEDEGLRDPDEMEIYDGRIKARAAADSFIPTEKGSSLIRDPKWPEGNPTQQGYFRNDIQSRMSYTQFWILVRENRVERVRFTDDKRAFWVTTKANAPGGVRVEKIGIPFDPQLPDHLLMHRVQIDDNESVPGVKFLFNMARIVLPIAFAVTIQKLLYNLGQPKKSSDDVFAQARLEKYQGKGQIGVTFDDVAGADAVKEEMQEIIEFLRNPRRFIELGCRTPAGVLLAGPPGTGKTLLAKAVAGEAGVPFFSAAGTEFAEIYSGVGASRVRDMFEVARQNSPCILFIDEFDSIGKARGSSAAGANDENVATINQLLTELDGFENNEGILVMAATNRPAALDDALTRPGRFDRIITMGLPNNEGRLGIFRVHARKKTVADDVDWGLLARATTSFSGAEIMNVVNVAAILTVQSREHSITQERLFDAIEKVLTEKAYRGNFTKEEPLDVDSIPPIIKRLVAVYISAKAVVAYMTPFFDDVIKITCCPDNQPSGQVFFCATG
jgi:ATP-dependent metalloprotease FtsH